MVALVTISISFFFRGPFDDSSAAGFLSNAAICVKKMHNGVKKIVKEATPFLVRKLVIEAVTYSQLLARNSGENC